MSIVKLGSNLCLNVILFCFLLLGLSMVNPSPAQADGKIYPPNLMAVAPDMPAQSALLIYKDGTESLVISNQFEGDDSEYGWILPLPSEPININEVYGAPIKELKRITQPEVVSEDLMIVGFSFLFALLMLLLFVVKAFIPKLFKLFATALFIVVLLGILFALTTSTMGGKLGGSQHGITVLSSEIVGNSKVTVLTAVDSETLGNWLSSNGFATLSEPEKLVISEYIADGWVFAATKLLKTEKGLGDTKPIEFVFKSPKPVYPMKLTAHATDNLYLELFTITEKTAEADNLDLEYRSLLTFGDKDVKNRSEYSKKNHAISQGARAYEPFVMSRMWKNCVLTAFRTKLSSIDMQNDIDIELVDGEVNEYIKTVFSTEGAYYYAASIVYLIFGFLLLIGLVLLIMKGDLITWKRKGIYFIASFLISLLIGVAFYYAVAKRPTTTMPRMNRFYSILSFYKLDGVFDGLDGLTGEEAMKIAAAEIAKEREGRWYKDMLREGTEIGNYKLFVHDGTLCIIVYGILHNLRSSVIFELVKLKE